MQYPSNQLANQMTDPARAGQRSGGGGGDAALLGGQGLRLCYVQPRVRIGLHRPGEKPLLEGTRLGEEG